MEVYAQYLPLTVEGIVYILLIMAEESMADINHNLIRRIIADQQEEHGVPHHYIQRVIESKLFSLSKNKEILVITGMRRCGKSVLLHHLRNTLVESCYYFNFEDERLVTFSSDDFQTLQEVFVELFGIQKTFYFDEIQNINGWETFVRRLYNNGNKIYITGSNAKFFSQELGTRLTGRYIPICIYPLSFFEYLRYKKPELLKKRNFSTNEVGKIRRYFTEYCKEGGIPEYVKYQHIDYLNALYESIIYRDIIARYRISNDTIIKQLVFYLASNCGKTFTYSSLRKLLGIGSVSTVSDYCSYLENSYLCFFVRRYSHSVKVQLLSPQKVYFVDHAIAKIVGFRATEDFGRMLENIVFLELKRRNYEVYYYQEKRECDFIIFSDKKIKGAIQVSKDITGQSTREREINSLLEALEYFSLSEGTIITEGAEFIEKIEKNNQHFKIIGISAWRWLLESY